MGFFSSMDISASALTAERFRLDVIAENIANMNTTRTAEGGPYRRKVVSFEQIEKPFAAYLDDSFKGAGVRVNAVNTDNSPFKLVYDPNHPDANEDGYVEMPNVDIVTEMIDMISASRAYEANITALNSFKNIAMRALEIGK